MEASFSSWSTSASRRLWPRRIREPARPSFDQVGEAGFDDAVGQGVQSGAVSADIGGDALAQFGK